MKSILVIVFYLLIALSSIAAKSDLHVHVNNNYGEPIGNVTVTIKGKGSKITNSKGIAVFPKSAKSGSKYKVSVDGTKDYKEFRKKLVLGKNSASLRIRIGWTYDKWMRLFNRVRNQKMDALEAVFAETDYSSFDSCDDSLGNKSEIPAEFPLGENLMQHFVLDNIEYPQTAVNLGEQGVVYATFVIEPDGSINEVKIERGVSRDLDRETKRLIQSMPKWIPGTCNGEGVRTRARLPVVFRLH